MKTKNKLVSRKKLGSPVKKEYAEKLKQLSEKTLIPQSRLLDQSLTMLFEYYKDILNK
mgnify:CR=1 FL=1